MDEVRKNTKNNKCVLNVEGSIIPCLSLRGVAASIARSRSLRAKILLCKHLIHPLIGMEVDLSQ